jgi:ElaA protein
VHVATFDELETVTLYALLRLRADVFVVEQACPYPDLDGRDLDAGTRHLWLTAADGGPPLAYLRVLDEPGAARIGRVCVRADARRAGHAATLLAAALRTIGNRDAVLHAQSYATALYERAGFVADGPKFDEDGIPHLPMRRRASACMPSPPKPIL